jgi:hypothetical protein
MKTAVHFHQIFDWNKLNQNSDKDHKTSFHFTVKYGHSDHEEAPMAKPKEKGSKEKPKSEVSKEGMEVAAYYRWLNRGCPANDDLSDWVEAEKESGN